MTVSYGENEISFRYGEYGNETFLTLIVKGDMGRGVSLYSSVACKGTAENLLCLFFKVCFSCLFAKIDLLSCAYSDYGLNSALQWSSVW
jgi:hypothetical protein